MNEDISKISNDELLKRYNSLVKSIAYKYSKYWLAQEDLEQEAFIGLIEAKAHYKPDKGAQFQTYATFWIKKRILSHLDKEFKNNKNIQFNDEFKLDDLVDTTNYEHNPETQSLSLDHDMPDYEALILRMSFEDKKSLNQIAKELNLNREKVRQIKQKAMRRFKKSVLKKNEE